MPVVKRRRADMWITQSRHSRRSCRSRSDILRGVMRVIRPHVSSPTCQAYHQLDKKHAARPCCLDVTPSAERGIGSRDGRPTAAGRVIFRDEFDSCIGHCCHSE